MVAHKHQQMEEPIQLQESPSAGVAAQMAMIARHYIPRIERRRIMRAGYRTQAWLQPMDETGAIRSPVIHTRDLDPLGLGFIARQDFAAIESGILHLPATNGRAVRIRCRIRRSREFSLGWYEGVLEFLEEQPMFAVRRQM